MKKLMYVWPLSLLFIFGCPVSDPGVAVVGGLVILDHLEGTLEDIAEDGMPMEVPTPVHDPVESDDDDLDDEDEDDDDNDD